MSESDGKTIARWKWMADENGDFYMERWGTGDWVTYKDHLAQLAATDAVIERLAGAVAYMIEVLALPAPKEGQ